MPKTGGTWVESAMTALHGPPQMIGRGHDSLEQAGLTYEGAFGVLRDPESWYFSLYFYMHKTAAWRRSLLAWGEGQDDFLSVLSGWVDPSRLPQPALRGGLVDVDVPWPPDRSLYAYLIDYYAFPRIQLFDFALLHAYFPSAGPPINVGRGRRQATTEERLRLREDICLYQGLQSQTTRAVKHR